MSVEYTIERAGVATTPGYREVEMIEAAGLPWQEAADLPDGTEFAVLEFGGVTFKVYRSVSAADCQ